MFDFGTRSKAQLLTVRGDLRDVAYEVMGWQIFDFAIICGWRSELDQYDAFMLGNSSVMWPDSAHNNLDEAGAPESDAFDFAPWCLLPTGRMGIPWKDTHAFAVLGGMFIAAGACLDVPITYGGDWDMDGSTTDQNLMDWGHVEALNR